MGNGIKRRDFLKLAGAASLAATMPSIPKRVLASLDKGYVHFGGSLALTGTYAKVARMYKDAYEFYLETVKNKMTISGKEYEIKLTLYDDENDPTKTAQLTEKLLTVDKVDLILSAYGTDPVMAQCAICKKYGKILINGGAASRRVDEEFAGTAFTLVPTGDYYHRTIIDMVSKLDPPLKTVAIITPDDAVYHEIAGAVKEQCGRYGIQTVFEDVIPMDAVDLGPTVLKMQAKQPDMVVNTGWDKILASFVNEAIKYKMKLKFLDGGHAMLTPFLKESLGSKLKNISGVTFFMPEARTKDIHYRDSLEFSQKYTDKYAGQPSYQSVLAYTVFELFEILLKDADAKDPFNTDYLRNGLFKMDRDLIWGRIRFNEKGRILKDMLVIQFQGDPPAPVIVYPPENATAKLNYPSDPLAG